MKRIVSYAAFVTFFCMAFTAQSQVSADFTSNKTEACSPLVVQFSNQSTGNISSWFWSFGNGNTSTQQNPSAVYVQPGNYTVTLIVSNGLESDTMVKTNFISVFYPPQVDFSPSVTLGCAPLTVEFTDLTQPGSSGLKNWAWNFGEGGVSYIQNPVHTYTQPGSYSVTLLVFDDNGCKHQITYDNLITIHQAPQADFVNVNSNQGCSAPVEVLFQNMSTAGGNMTYHWDFGNGQTSTAENPSATYLTEGIFDVVLTVTDEFGCISVNTKSNYIVVDNLTADFSVSNTTPCINQQVTFSELTNGTASTFKWNFGNGQTSTQANPVVSFADSGSYTITLIASTNSGCKDTIIKENYITVTSKPEVAIISDISSDCKVPATVGFTTDFSGASSYLWKFGDGNTSTLQNPTYTYTSFGSYSVELEIETFSGCRIVVTEPAMITLTSPDNNFSVDTNLGCVPLDVQFTSDTSANPTAVNWFWDFGDGNISTDAHPAHTYSIEGIFHVTLIVENASGCMDTIVKNNFVRAGNQPVANFAATPLVACMNIPINFTNLSDSANIYYWNFGDGGFSNLPDPVYTYSDSGSFSVTLIALNNGCPDTLLIEDYIYINPPLAGYQYVQSCTDPYTVTFFDESFAPDTWLWTFDDGTQTTDLNPVHTFNQTGTYSVKLEVSHIASGCVDEMIQTITIADPKAEFVALTQEGCAPFTFELTDLSTDANAWSWNVNGMSSSQQNPTFTLDEPGVYDVNLVITDVNGCKDTIFKADYISVKGPKAVFVATPQEGCSPLTVQFEDQSTGFLGNITQWGWDFGDGNVGTGPFPSHTFNQTGTFNVSLTVVDENGCNHTVFKPDFVQPTFPQPAFSVADSSCTGKLIQFQNNSTGVGLTYLWDFGDSTFSTESSPQHLFAEEGFYSVTLTVTDVNGCDSTIVSDHQIVISNPVAEFTADTTFSPCPPLLVNFTSHSTQDVVSWQWDFGDGKISNIENPTHVYTAPGTFDVTLVVTSVYGCKDTLFVPGHTIVLGPNGTFDFTPQKGCIDLTVDFNSTTFNTVGWIWDFGDGSVLHGGDSAVSHTYTSVGNYHPVMILDDGLGCLFSVESEDSVRSGTMIADFAASTEYLCHSGEVVFGSIVNSFPVEVDYFWDFGDSTTSVDANPVHFYSTPGIYTVTLIVDNGVCADTVIKPDFIEVDSGPAVSFVPSETVSCDPMEVTFTNQTVSTYPITSWYWDFGNGDTDSTESPSKFFADADTFNVTLTATTTAGCFNQHTETIIIHPKPLANAGSDVEICYADSTQLNGSGGLYYEWSPSTWLDDHQSAQPIAKPEQSTTYNLTVTDENGCQNSTYVNVVVMPLPIITVSSDIEICEGTSGDVSVQGGQYYTYVWTPAASVECEMCTVTNVTPQQTTTYTVEATNLNGCKKQEHVEVVVRPNPVGITTPNQQICYGDSVQIDIADVVVYDWSSTEGLSCVDCPNPVVRPEVSTQYFLFGENLYGCTSYSSFTVQVNPLPETTLTKDTAICLGESVELTVSGGEIYSWENIPGLSCYNCDNPVASPDETATYTVVTTNTYGCIFNDAVTITVNPLPEVSLMNNQVICPGESFTISGEYSNDVINWEWLPETGLNQYNIGNPEASPLETTVYQVKVSNAYACTANDEIEVKVIHSVASNQNFDTEICIGDMAEFNVEVSDSSTISGVTYNWYNASGNLVSELQNPVFNPAVTTEYLLIVKSGSCTADTIIFPVVVNPLPVVDAGVDKHVVSGTYVELAATSNHANTRFDWINYFTGWNCTNCNGEWAQIDQESILTVTATDENGCVNTDSRRIKVVEHCGAEIFVPNTFSPNGDEKNDKLFVRTLAVERINFFRVYDRWGQIIFETNDKMRGWDGRVNGRMMNTGVYVYHIEAVCTTGQIVQKKGNTTLLR